MNFLDLYKTLKRLDEGDMNQGTGIMAPPSMPETNECGSGMEGQCPNEQPSQPKQQDSVSMSVNMNGQGAGGIRDLMDILRNIDTNLPSADNKKDNVLVGNPEDKPKEIPLGISKPAEEPMKEPEMDEEEYENEPATQEFDNIISGDDLNKEKAAYPMAQKGDNAMASIKKAAVISSISESLLNRLSSHYNEVKTRK